MSPETPGTGDANLRLQQDALAAYIRDPERVPPPPGIEERRLKIYRDLFFNNVAGLLAGNFPVIRRTWGDARWPVLVRAFYREHGCRTPLFTELPREFLRWLENGGAADAPPWLRELAHYEWIELALQISEADDGDIALDEAFDVGDAASALLDGSPALSPLAWPLAYAWPVHRIGPDHQPAAVPPEPTLLLVHRERGGKVGFHVLSPLAFRLLQRLDETPGLSGRAQLEALATEAGQQELASFLDQGSAMLVDWHRRGIVLGIRAHPPA